MQRGDGTQIEKDLLTDFRNCEKVSEFKMKFTGAKPVILVVSKCYQKFASIPLLTQSVKIKGFYREMMDYWSY